MPTCPNGHQSVSDDWCEVCGHRMAGAGAPAGAVPPPPPPPPAYGYPGPGGPGQPPMGPPPGGHGAPGGHGGPGAPGGFGHGGDPNATAQAELCPQCRTPREHMAPFCEECRWNFLTNTATSYTPLAPQQSGPPPGLNLPPGFQSPPPPPPQQQPPQPPQQDPFGYQGSRPSQVNRPAEPLGAEPTHHQAPQRPPVQQPPMQQPMQPPVQQQQAPPAYLQAPPPQAPVQAPVPPAPPQPRADDDWVLSPPSQPQPPQHQAPPQPPQQQQFQHQQPPQQQHHQQQPQQFQHEPPRPPLGWTAVIGPDREYFMAMMHRSGPEATGLNLPAYSPDKHLPLQGNQISIGRRRRLHRRVPRHRPVGAAGGPGRLAPARRARAAAGRVVGCGGPELHQRHHDQRRRGADPALRPRPAPGGRPGARRRLDDDHDPPRLGHDPPDRP